MAAWTAERAAAASDGKVEEEDDEGDCALEEGLALDVATAKAAAEAAAAELEHRKKVRGGLVACFCVLSDCSCVRVLLLVPCSTMSATDVAAPAQGIRADVIVVARV